MTAGVLGMALLFFYSLGVPDAAEFSGLGGADTAGHGVRRWEIFG